MSLPEELSAFEQDVMLAAERHERESFRSNGCNDNGSSEYEREALQRLYNVAIKSGPTAPRVPSLVHFFYSSDRRTRYIIMERTAVRAVSDDELCPKAADAVLWLHDQHMDLFGDLGGGKTRHTVFQGSCAPRAFTSVQAMQTYLNVAVDQARRVTKRSIENINLMGDTVVLTQSDMDASNFGVAYDGRPVIFDAATIQALPKTMADFTLLRTSVFAKAVSAHVFSPEERDALLASVKFDSLCKARGTLFMGDDILGVDKDGNIEPRKRARLTSKFAAAP